MSLRMRATAAVGRLIWRQCHPRQYPSFLLNSVEQQRWLRTEGPTLEAQVVDRRTVRSQQVEEEETSRLEAQLQDALQQYRDLASNNGSDTQLLVDSLERLQECYHELQYWDDAIATERALLELLEQGDDSTTTDVVVEEQDRLIAKAYERLGTHHYHLDQYASSRQYHQRALDLYTELHRPDCDFHADMGKMIHGMACSFIEEEDFDKAIPLLKQAEQHYRYHGSNIQQDGQRAFDDDLQPHPDLIKVLGNQALVFRKLGQYQNAIERYEELQTHLKPEQEKERQDNDLDLADCFWANGDLAQAFMYFDSILLKLVQERDEKDMESALEGVLRHNLGELHFKLGRPEMALEFLEQAYRIKKRLAGEVHPEVATTLNGLGAVHAVLGHTRQALSYFRESLLIARIYADGDDEDPTVLHALRNISLAEQRRGDFPTRQEEEEQEEEDSSS